MGTSCQPTDYFDDVQKSCHPCRDICSSTASSSYGPHRDQCRAACSGPQVQAATREDVHQLLVLVTATAAMTCLVLVLLCTLLVVKMRRRRGRRKKSGVAPFCTYEVKSESVQVEVDANNSTNTNNTNNSSNNKINLKSGNSIQTLSTHLSQETEYPVHQSYLGRSGTISPTTIGERSTRFPSEDMVNISDRSCNTVTSSPDSSKRQKPYTISHSQVV